MTNSGGWSCTVVRPATAVRNSTPRACCGWRTIPPRTDDTSVFHYGNSDVFRSGVISHPSKRLPTPISGPPSVTSPSVADPHQWQQPDFSTFIGDGGTSFAGFRSKNPAGFRVKPMYVAGMTG